MLEKIKRALNSWDNNIKGYWADKRYVRAVGTLILPPMTIGLAIVLLILALTTAFDFLRRHYAQLICVALGIWAFIAWWDKHKADTIEIERKEQAIRERRDQSDKLEAARTKDATYTAGAKFLFPSVRELGPLGIVPPATLSNIYSQGRTVPQMGGAVVLNVYLLQKGCESVDTDLIKHTLQLKIDQRLQAGEFPGIEEQHVYRGRVYSGFVVDRVRDSMGGFVEIYTTFVNDAYCQYLERRNLNSGILLPSVDRRDTDY